MINSCFLFIFQKYRKINESQRWKKKLGFQTELSGISIKTLQIIWDQNSGQKKGQASFERGIKNICRCKVVKAYFSLYMMTTMLVNISGAVTKSTKILPWMIVYVVHAIQKHKSYKTHVFLIHGLSGDNLLHFIPLHLAFYPISKKILRVCLR